MLVVDMVTDGSGAAEPRIRETGSAAILQFPQQVFLHQVFPQIVAPQLVFNPQQK